MGSEYGHLTLDERRRMFQLREARQPVALIAATLGRHKSTIYRELRRNFFRGEGPEWQGYFPVTADKVARDRRQRLSKLVARADLRDHVIDRLQVGWSPQQIAGRLGNRRMGQVACATRRSTASSMVGMDVSGTSIATLPRADAFVAAALAASHGKTPSRTHTGSPIVQSRLVSARNSAIGKAIC